MDIQTPKRNAFAKSMSPVLEKSLIINHNRRDLRNSSLWGIINSGILFLLIYDVYYMCPFYFNYYHYIEYALIVILTFNVVYYVSKVLRISLIKYEPITITEEQRKLLGIDPSDPCYKIKTPSSPSINTGSAPSTPITFSPTNMSALSWRSNISQSDSMNYTLSSSWTYAKGSPKDISHKTSPMLANPSPSKLLYQDVSTVENITDKETLEKYLKEHNTREKHINLTNKSQQSSNLLSSFWSHPVTKTAKDMSSFLKKCQYQLSTLSPVKTSSPTNKEDQTASPGQVSILEVWTRINVDSVALTQWNENLRKWISQTILERIVDEFERINASLEKHGLSDIKIGCVGLDRLRKTAQTVPISHFIPSLSTLLPFLEITTNQEYLEKRIRELSRGGCMSEFKWNGGSSYKGKDWDESLPTDCAIIMHFLACYLDTQLMPLPNMPDTKAFTGHHYIRATDKMPTLNPNSLFIQEVTEKPPHFRVIIGEKVYEMVKGHNNLFHSILFFIYHVNKMEHGMLGRVNLGRAGVNILWVIDQ